ncbi:hypothetical protein VHP8226_02286 [Vibrio hippocampi]|uniref:Uncharacterized protein n=1 Tax=Vibrio hippocampi TaxID=654686 RepID=A0ABN8DH01_9VIBR|nr:hypothetical protein VHP8226_02286 [Vibrio hippocampi]
MMNHREPKVDQAYAWLNDQNNIKKTAKGSLFFVSVFFVSVKASG